MFKEILLLTDQHHFSAPKRDTHTGRKYVFFIHVQVNDLFKRFAILPYFKLKIIRTLQ